MAEIPNNLIGSIIESGYMSNTIKGEVRAIWFQNGELMVVAGVAKPMTMIICECVIWNGLTTIVAIWMDTFQP